MALNAIRRTACFPPVAICTLWMFLSWIFSLRIREGRPFGFGTVEINDNKRGEGWSRPVGSGGGSGIGNVTFQNKSKDGRWQDTGDDPCRFLTCPPGDYLGHSSDKRDKQNARLCALHKTLREKGRQQNPKEHDVYLERGYAVYESSLWPKQQQCLHAEENKSGPNCKDRQFKMDGPPSYIKRLVYEGLGFEFHKNHKVASCSLPGYLQYLTTLG
mmetsp:Transcript_36624/g.74712  ORF Transcript_36624/g.74712 Transcript_36624/m.74712 type:complete len:215 (-) Transcript_36624:338-982(-)